MQVTHGAMLAVLDAASQTLASRGGFSTAEESMEVIVVKIAELVETVADDEADELSMKSGTQ